MNTTFKIRIGNNLHSIPIEYTIHENRVYIRAPYNKDLIEEIKCMKGPKWHKDQRVWSVELCERNTYAFEYLVNGNNTLVWSPVRCFERDSLFPWQGLGHYFIRHKRRCMLAFEMGLGKTFTVISAIEDVIKQEQLCSWWLVAPTGAQFEWKRQLKKWNAKFNFSVVTTYESLKKQMDSLSDDFIPDGIVFDESVKIKNPVAIRSQVAAEMCRLIRSKNGYIILLSGAPAPKNPSDWWHQIECIQPGFIREGSIHKFIDRYAETETVDHGYGPHKEIVRWKEDEVAALGKRLSPIVLCKQKKDCLELPEKIFEEIDVMAGLTLAQREEEIKSAIFAADMAPNGISALEILRELSDGFIYERETRDDRGTASSNDTEPGDSDTVPSGESKGARRNKRTQQTNNPKLRIVDELLDFYQIENGGPGRLVIYAAFHGSIDIISEHCKEKGWKVGVVDGRGWRTLGFDYAFKNEELLEIFEQAEGEPSYDFVIVANPGCVHGLTLSRTLCLCYFSNSFNVDHRIQSLDRRDRPGMDVSRGTRIVDILNLPTDKYILDKLNKGISIQNITLQEIKLCLKNSS